MSHTISANKQYFSLQQINKQYFQPWLFSGTIFSAAMAFQQGIALLLLIEDPTQRDLTRCFSGGHFQDRWQKLTARLTWLPAISSTRYFCHSSVKPLHLSSTANISLQTQISRPTTMTSTVTEHIYAHQLFRPTVTGYHWKHSPCIPDIQINNDKRSLRTSYSTTTAGRTTRTTETSNRQGK